MEKIFGRMIRMRYHPFLFFFKDQLRIFKEASKQPIIIHSNNYHRTEISFTLGLSSSPQGRMIIMITIIMIIIINYFEDDFLGNLY